MKINDETRVLWDLLPHPSPGHVVRLFARKGDKKFGDFARSPREMQLFIDGLPDFNHYVALNPTLSTVGTRHSAQDVTHWSYFPIDVDPVEERNDPSAVLDEALLWLGEWNGRDLGTTGHQPIIIDSGRGMQAWVRLQDIILDDAQAQGQFIGMAYDVMRGQPMENPTGICTRKSARKSMGWWMKKLADKIGTMHGCRIDTSCSDLPRVMRMPGTINQKTGRPTRIVNATSYIERGLAQLLVNMTPKTVFTEPDPGTYPAGTPWQTAFTQLTRKAQNYLLEGKTEPGRHEVMWHTARVLCEKGIDREQTRVALAHANRLNGDENALSQIEIEHALDTAYGV